MIDQNELGIYLNDHLAGATGGVELARRAAQGSTRHREALRALATELAEDRSALRQIMRTLGVPARHYKQYAAWVAEKIGRLKLNGQLAGRAPLSDVLEIELLRLVVEGKTAGWRLLRRLAEDDDRLDQDLLDRLLVRAERQGQILDELHMRAATAVFTRRPGG